MIGKITIRRMGSRWPAICLLLSVILSVGVLWLSTHGFPASVVRYVESKAAEHGVPMHIDTLRLDPARGLVLRANGIKIFDKTGRTIADAGGLTVGVSLSHLLIGEVRPSLLLLTGGSMTLPVTDPAGKSLGVRDINLGLDVSGGNLLQVTTGSMSIQGIPVSIMGALNIADLLKDKPRDEQPAPKAASKKAQPTDPITLLEKHQHNINRIYDILAQQKWTADNHPNINITLTPESGLCAEMLVDIPQFDVDQFHFRDIKLNLRYSNDQILISPFSFTTINPNTEVSFMGGYDLNNERLSFVLTSNADLLEMVEYVRDEDAKSVLAKFSFPEDKYPKIHLKGDVAFDDLQNNYSLDSAMIEGAIHQQELRVGSVPLSNLDIEFKYENGDFSINKLRFDMPEKGFVSLQAHASRQPDAKENERGRGTLDLNAYLPVDTTLKLVRELRAKGLRLPPELKLGSYMSLALNADLEMLVFKPGETMWQDYMPGILGMDFKVHSDQLEYDGAKVTDACVEGHFHGINQNHKLMPDVIQSADMTLQAAEIELAAEEDPPLAVQGAKLELKLDDTRGIGEPEKAFDKIAVSAMNIALSASGVRRGKEQILSVEEAQANVALREVTINGHFAPETLSIGKIIPTAKAKSLRIGALTSPLATLQVSSINSVHSFSDLENRLKTLQINAKIDHITLADTEKKATAPEPDSEAPTAPPTQLGSVAMQFLMGKEYVRNAPASALFCGKLQIHHEEEDPHQLLSQLSLNLIAENDSHLVFNEVGIALHGKSLRMVCDALNTKIKGVELPDLVEIKGMNGVISREGKEEKKLSAHSELSFNIPSLVRAPYKQEELLGKKVEIGISGEAMVHLAPGADMPQFMITNLRVAERNVVIPNQSDSEMMKKSSKGSFEGSVNGMQPGLIIVNGAITMRPDVVDVLLDSRDAHSIIGDFKFSEASNVLVDKINTKVEYTNGLKVTSDCDVLIENSAFLISTNETKDKMAKGADHHTWLKKTSCHVHVDVLENCVDANGKKLNNESVVTMSNIDMLYNNSPWLQRQKIRSGVYESKLQAAEVVIDIERSFVRLTNVRGTAYPAYAFGMFYPTLYDLLKDVTLPRPVQLSAPKCLFPIYSDCQEPMSGTIRVISPSGAKFHFIGTDIPLDDFSGFIYMTDNYVQLDRLNARTWQGVLDAAVKIGIGKNKKTSFDGYVKAQCMDLKLIANAYKNKQESALVNAEVRFRSPSANLKSLRAYGKADVENGDLMNLSIFTPLSALISDLPGQFSRLEGEVIEATGRPAPKQGAVGRFFSNIFKRLGNITSSAGDRVSRIVSDVPGVNHLIAYDLQEAHAQFDIVNGHLITRSMKAKGYNLNVHLDLDINLETLELNGSIKPRISSLPTILLSPITFISNYMVDIIIYGKLSQIKWKIGLARKHPSEPPCATSAPDKEMKPRKKANRR